MLIGSLGAGMGQVLIIQLGGALAIFREESGRRETGKDLIPDFALSLGSYGHLLNQVMS